MLYKKVISLLKQSIKEVYDKESYLLELNVGERCLVAHVYAALKMRCAADKELKSYSVDCEYNREGIDQRPKQLIGQVREMVIPDVVIHKRGACDNVLILEFKKAGKDTSWDEKKLIAYTDLNEDAHLRYQIGSLVILGSSYEGCKFQFFHKGTQKDEASLIIGE